MRHIEIFGKTDLFLYNPPCHTAEEIQKRFYIVVEKQCGGQSNEKNPIEMFELKSHTQ